MAAFEAGIAVVEADQGLGGEIAAFSCPPGLCSVARAGMTLPPKFRWMHEDVHPSPGLPS